MNPPTSTTEANKYCSYAAWRSYFIIFLMITIPVTVIVMTSVAINRTEAFSSFMNNQESVKEYKKNHAFIITTTPNSNSLLSIPNIIDSKATDRIDYCSLAEYYLFDRANQSELIKPVNGLKISELQTNIRLRGAFYYMIKTSFNIQFNIDIDQYAPLPLDNRRNYLSFKYNITSRITDFTSIRLAELEFDAVGQSLKKARLITLCSNNSPEKESLITEGSSPLYIERCDSSRFILGNGNILSLHGEQIASLFHPMYDTRNLKIPSITRPPPPPSLSPSRSPRPSSSPPPPSRNIPGFGNPPPSPPQSHVSDLVYQWDPDTLQYTTDLMIMSNMNERIYNIIFYRGDENEVLSIEPSHCR